MAGAVEWDSEAAAGTLVADTVGGAWSRHDHVVGPDSMYDLHVVSADGRRIAVEVTSETDRAVREQHGNEPADGWIVEDLTGFWSVKVFEPVDMKWLRAALPRLLQDLESVDRTEFTADAHDPSDIVHEGMQRLRVRSCLRLCDRTPGLIDISAATYASAGSSETIVRAVEDHAHRPDNIFKLEKAVDVDERHLFVWAHTDRVQLAAALRGKLVPTRPPDLPATIDVVWIAAAIGDLRVALRYSRPEGWAYVATPPRGADRSELSAANDEQR